MPLYTNIQKFHYLLPILGKRFIALAYEKSESNPPISHRSLKAKFAVTQHFSLGALEFVRFAKEEFSSFKSSFIELSQFLKLIEFFERTEEFLNQKVFANSPPRIKIGKRGFRLSHPSAAIH